MSRETELKFALGAEDAAALGRSPPLAAVPGSRHRLLALYFDTPARELAANGMALRLRRESGRWSVTLKGAGTSTGGLHSRGEWEFPRRDASIDLALFADTPLARLDDAARLHERLREAFRVEFLRTAWLLEPAPGTRLEVALDRGAAAADGRVAPVCEVEIETLEGEPAAAFELAGRLLEHVSLRPSVVTKAERGYRLLDGGRPHPAKAPPIVLHETDTPLEAARTVVGAALAQLQANEEGLLASTDPEFVHQARVALRRMRSALRIFREPVGIDRSNAWREALGEFANALGAARDWDVFGTEVLPPVQRAFGDRPLERSLRGRCGHRRHMEREAARAAVRSRDYARVMLDIARWLALPEAPPVFAESTVDFASRIIRRRHKRLLADAARFASLSAEQRHRLRIDVKRLRYSLDAMASLFPARRVQRYLDVLVALQDALGQANDAATAGRLLPALDPPEPFALYARGWFAAQAAGDRLAFDSLIAGLAATPRFWRRAPRPQGVEA